MLSVSAGCTNALQRQAVLAACTFCMPSSRVQQCGTLAVACHGFGCTITPVRLVSPKVLEVQRESATNTYSTWYPPVRQTLMCLSKLYRTVEHKVFAGLAQDAIAACTVAVQVRS